jgi:tetratricopeptide (TPR) repeat protein
MDQKQWPKAEKTLTDAVASRPDASTAYFALGEVYRREKKYQEGEKILLQGLKLNPDSAEGHTTLGELYWDWAGTASSDDIYKTRLESSWHEDKQALQLKPGYADAHLLAGNLMLKVRRAPEALTHYEEYLKLDPNGPYAKEASTMIQKIKQALEQSNKK